MTVSRSSHAVSVFNWFSSSNGFTDGAQSEMLGCVLKLADKRNVTV